MDRSSAFVMWTRRHLTERGARFKEAGKYFDFRRMLDEMGDKIDAVTVSTPDHNHAVAAVMAMKQGKALFLPEATVTFHPRSSRHG